MSHWEKHCHLEDNNTTMFQECSLPDPEVWERMRSFFERCRTFRGVRAQWSTRRCCSRALRWWRPSGLFRLRSWCCDRLPLRNDRRRAWTGTSRSRQPVYLTKSSREGCGEDEHKWWHQPNLIYYIEFFQVPHCILTSQNSIIAAYKTKNIN